MRTTHAALEDADGPLVRALVEHFDKEASLWTSAKDAAPQDSDESAASAASASASEPTEEVAEVADTPSGGSRPSNPVLAPHASIHLQMLYLRIVHSFDVFNGGDFLIEDDLGKQ